MSSMIRITTTLEGFQLMNEFVSKKLVEIPDYCNRNLMDSFHQLIISKGEDYVILGWDCVKFVDWCKDVKGIKDSLIYLEELNIPFKFYELYEDYSSIVEKSEFDENNVLPDIWAEIQFNCDLDKSKYFALFSCDEWKGHSSMRLIGVFTREGLNKQLNKEVEGGNMELSESDALEELSIKEIDNSLSYGFIQELSINEAL